MPKILGFLLVVFFEYVLLTQIFTTVTAFIKYGATDRAIAALIATIFISGGLIVYIFNMLWPYKI